MHKSLFIGLISGTSADGIDAALVSFDQSTRVLAARTTPYSPETRELVLRLSQADGRVLLDELGALDSALGEAFAAAALALIAESGLDASNIRAIGSHGQTLRHRPKAPHRFTMQIADPHVIAERTGIDVVADFRRRDVAAGGEGAPLMPAFHASVLAAPGEDRAVLNIGGIANLTLLPANGPIRGFDTGPGNGLLDAWCQQHTGNPFDRGGEWGAAGRVIPELLKACLQEPWLARPPPKSSGRDHFHLEWLATKLGGDELPQDVQATLVELTARSIIEALRGTQPSTQQVIVCGGGVHNALLMARLSALLPGAGVASSAAFGIDPDAMEAAGFAWLAQQTLQGLAGNRPEVTGAAGTRVLGALVPGSAQGFSGGFCV